MKCDLASIMTSMKEISFVVLQIATLGDYKKKNSRAHTQTHSYLYIWISVLYILGWLPFVVWYNKL